MIVRAGTVHLIAEASADGTLTARRLIVVDGETGKREQVWPEAARPVLSVPQIVGVVREAQSRRVF